MKLINVIFGLLLAFCSAVVFAQAIDINTATAGQLEGIEGDWSEESGRNCEVSGGQRSFKSVEDLSKVSGVGEKHSPPIRIC
ncbi:MAG: hypothetical protein IPP10_16410 [Candidatus Competibacteraceae bacterium]|nr:hypothetical protein [Candidatus Competibacteraceae bacterium]